MRIYRDIIDRTSLKGFLGVCIILAASETRTGQFFTFTSDGTRFFVTFFQWYFAYTYATCRRYYQLLRVQ